MWSGAILARSCHEVIDRGRNDRLFTAARIFFAVNTYVKHSKTAGIVAPCQAIYLGDE